MLLCLCFPRVYTCKLSSRGGTFAVNRQVVAFYVLGFPKYPCAVFLRSQICCESAGIRASGFVVACFPKRSAHAVFLRCPSSFLLGG